MGCLALKTAYMKMEDSRARRRRYGTFAQRPQMAPTQSEELSVSRFAPRPKKKFNAGKVIFLYSIGAGNKARHISRKLCGDVPFDFKNTMSLSTYQLASILILLPSHVIGQIVQNNWVSPDGTEPDFQQTFINSNVLGVALEGWNSRTRTQYFEEESTTADLWVTSYNFALSPFSQLLSGKKRISLSSPTVS